MTNTYLFDGDTFEHKGRKFRVEFAPDYDNVAPWEDDDGRGLVRESRGVHRYCEGDKRPGERALNDPVRNQFQYYYDWAGTMKKATSDGWGLANESLAALSKRLGRIPTKREIVAESVRLDYEYIRAWLNDDWQYFCVTVTALDADGNDTDYFSSLGRVESYMDYHIDMAYELADEVIYQMEEDEREARATARRDIETARQTIHVINRRTIDLIRALRSESETWPEIVTDCVCDAIRKALIRRTALFDCIAANRAIIEGE